MGSANANGRNPAIANGRNPNIWTAVRMIRKEGGGGAISPPPKQVPLHRDAMVVTERILCSSHPHCS